MTREDMGLSDEVAQELELAKNGQPELNELTKRDIRLANVVAWAIYGAYNVGLYDYRRLAELDDTYKRTVRARIAIGNFGIANNKAAAAAAEFLGGQVLQPGGDQRV